MKTTTENCRINKHSFVTAILVLGCFCLAGGFHAKAQAPAGELQKADQIRRLTPQEADHHLPVRLKGVVTFIDQRIANAGYQFLQDDTAGIYFYMRDAMLDSNLVAGVLVQIEGHTDKGQFAPVVTVQQYRVLGEGTFPQARPVSAEQLISGQEDSQFVEVQGIVRAVRFENATGNFVIDMMSEGERFTVYVKQLGVSEPDTLVDSTVRVRGVCATLFNRQRQLYGVRLLVPRPDDIIVEKPAGTRPFEIPVQPIASLLQFAPQWGHGHRVKVAGTAVYFEPGVALFIQNEQEGLYAQTRERTPLQAGDKVEILGFPAKGEYTPVLQDATFRKTGPGTAPEPQGVELDEVLKGTYDCRLVQIPATLLERTKRGREEFLVLQTGGFTFPGYLGQPGDGTEFGQLRNGSELSVTGICLIERGSAWQGGETWRAKSFRLLLRSPADVVVLNAPPWWTQGNPIGKMALGGAVVIAILLLIDILKRRGRKPEASGGE